MLTYCTNIHPGVSWPEVQAGIAANVPRIRDALLGASAAEPFPLGVWLSGRAAREITESGSSAFLDWCREHRCQIQSINGFPYGQFHGQQVKERAYLPDWRDPERRIYSEQLAEILASWLPAGETGVISTVPLGFKERSDWSLARRNVEQALERIDSIAQRTGKQIVLALEAEPGCMLETTSEVIEFFDSLHLAPHLARHLGVCFDCCHHAVEFESPAASLRRLSAAGVRVAQAHVTCAVRVPGGELARLEKFSEPVYLHQTVGRRTDGTLVRFDDLPQALAAKIDGAGIDEWRVHFHVPVFAEQLGDVRTTQPELSEMLSALPRETPLVVETYTFGVLPPALQAPTVTDSIIRELQWVRAQR